MKNEFKLSNGKEVWISDFNISWTFGSIKPFNRTKEGNLIYNEELTYPTSWGNIREYKVAPTEKELNSQLFNYFYCILLQSEYVIDQAEGFKGSKLVLMFTLNEFLQDDLHLVIQKHIESFDWDYIAEDF